ncbi:MAG: DoxX family membrane protein [Cytophagales bacterium]|nr:DoxX family membrane protein [Cytophagales bacterium]
MSSYSVPGFQKYLFTFLRMAIGWHFLYEGVAKIFTPDWSSVSYLLNSSGPLEGIFKAIVTNQFLIYLLDYTIIFGLIIIGLALFLGVATKAASIAGAALLFTFYISNPPFSINPIGYGVEGHYLIVNKNLVELLTLLVLAFIPGTWFYGLENISKVKPEAGITNMVDVPKEANHYLNPKAVDRRNLVKNLIAVPFLGGFVYSIARNYGWGSHEEKHLRNRVNSDSYSGATAKVVRQLDISELKKPIPSGVIKGQNIGRLICGGNLISGFAHSRDLIYVSNFLKKYFTTEKVIETFKLCEACGINTTAIGTGEAERSVLHKHWKLGGKIQWLAPIHPKEEDYKASVDLAVDNGAMGTMLVGNLGDQWARTGKFELINNVVEYSRSKGVIAGIAGHELATFQGLEAQGIDTDFYMKTLHDTSYWSWRGDEPKEKMVIDNYDVDNYWARKPQETIDFMNGLGKPWIAFKVLAAGAIHPRRGFNFAFQNGADFACVGMFDFQVVEDANMLNEVLDDKQFTRKRNWMA